MGRSRRGVTPSLARKVATRRPRKTVVVFCEGQRTEPEEFWCVFDVEWPTNHPHLIEASNLAEAHGIRLAVSNPCFELWLVLHFREHQAWLENEAAVRLRRACDHSKNKGLAAAEYMSRRETTAARAAALDKMHQRNSRAFRTTTPRPACDLLVTTVTTPLDE